MFGHYNTQSIVVSFDYDPAADDVLPVFRAPKALEIVGAYATVANAVAANGSVYFDVALLNGGTSGTATDALAGTVGGTVGWDALTPKTFTISDGTVAAGELIVVQYNENTTGTFGQLTVQLDYILGIA